MSQPPPYNRLSNFTDYAIAHPSAPYNASDHDAELNAVETTVDALCTNIALIQRDDGELANETVGIDQLETELRALISIGEDGTVEPWTTGHTYHPGDAVSFGVDAYLCVVTHVATTFALDLAAGYWVLIGIEALSVVADAALIAFTPVGTIAATNVQAAIEEVAVDAAAATAALAASSLSAATAAATYVPLTQKAAPLGVATLDALGIVLSSQLPSTGGPFVPLGEKGIANGVATLDAGVKVPVAQIPDLSATYIPLTQKAAMNGVATLDASGTIPIAQLPVQGYANCLFKFVGVGSCRLYPWGGNMLTIGGVARPIPDAGVLLANTDLPLNDTTYYVYASWSGSAIALEVSTTGYTVFPPNSGVAFKTGDTSRTLVGMARKTAGNFADAPLTRFARSFYNDRGIGGVGVSASAAVISAAPYVELDSAIRCQGLFWLNEVIQGVASFGGVGAAAPASGTLYAASQMDGVTSINPIQALQLTRALEFSSATSHFVSNGTAVEGYHYINVVGGITGLNVGLQSGYSGISYRTHRLGQGN